MFRHKKHLNYWINKIKNCILNLNLKKTYISFQYQNDYSELNEEKERFRIQLINVSQDGEQDSSTLKRNCLDLELANDTLRTDFDVLQQQVSLIIFVLLNLRNKKPNRTNSEFLCPNPNSRTSFWNLNFLFALVSKCLLRTMQK